MLVLMIWHCGRRMQSIRFQQLRCEVDEKAGPRVQMQQINLWNSQSDVVISLCNGWLLNGSRRVIPASLRQQVLLLPSLGSKVWSISLEWRFTGPTSMLMLSNSAREAVICLNIANSLRNAAVHLWMMPLTKWIVCADRAFNFLGLNRLLCVDAYTKYICIYPTQITSTKTAVEIVMEHFAQQWDIHFYRQPNYIQAQGLWDILPGITKTNAGPRSFRDPRRSLYSLFV